jgi:hypothetical protein
MRRIDQSTVVLSDEDLTRDWKGVSQALLHCEEVRFKLQLPFF